MASGIKSHSKPVYSAEISRRIADNRIADSIILLQDTTRSLGYSDLTDRLSTLDSTYRHLLDFMFRGLPDEGRKDMLTDIKGDLRDIAQELDRRVTMIDDPRLYFSTARLFDLRKTDLREVLELGREHSATISLAVAAGAVSQDILKAKEGAYDEIFNRIWTLGPNRKGDLTVLADTVTDNNTPYDLCCLIISALMLGMLQYYDSAKLMALFDIYERTQNEKLAARALTSILFAVARWSDRIRLDRKAMLRLEALQDSLVSYRRLREVIFSIIRTRDTDRVTQKMQNEVLPGLIKMGPDILRKMKDKAEDGLLSDIEDNPEWEELMAKTGLSDRMKELSEMQSQGADVMMVAFSNLKSFPFFRSMTNWFLPYTFYHSQLYGNGGLEADSLATLLESDGVMCDSDKFSFALSVAAMPESSRMMALSQLEGNMEQMKAELYERRLKSTTPKFDEEVTVYVRNLYRFYKLFSRHSDFADPFAKSFVFSSLPVIGEMMSEPEILRLTGEFYFKRGYYSEALPLLSRLTDEDGGDGHLWQKIGYCLETVGEYADALRSYQKAELFDPDSLWVIRRICSVLTQLGRYDEALPYARRVADTEPENIKTLVSLSDILVRLGRYDEALKIMYKADYLSDGDTDVRRHIVEGEMRAGRSVKASENIGRLLAASPTPDNYMLAGHLQMMLGDLAEAANFYQLSMDPQVAYEEWRKKLIEDAGDKTSGTADIETLMLLLDKLKYDRPDK